MNEIEDILNKCCANETLRMGYIDAFSARGVVYPFSALEPLACKCVELCLFK